MAGWGSFFSNAWRHSSVTVFHGKCTAPLTALRGFRCTSQRPRPVVNHSRKEASVWWYFLAHNTLRTPSCSHANVINSYNPMSVTYCKACIKLVVWLCIFFKTQKKKIAKIFSNQCPCATLEQHEWLLQRGTEQYYNTYPTTPSTSTATSVVNRCGWRSS